MTEIITGNSETADSTTSKNNTVDKGIIDQINKQPEVDDKLQDEIQKNLKNTAENNGVTLEQYNRFLELSKILTQHELSEDERKEFVEIQNIMTAHKEDLARRRRDLPASQV